MGEPNLITPAVTCWEAEIIIYKAGFTSIIFISETVTISEDINNNEEKLTEPEKENKKLSP